MPEYGEPRKKTGGSLPAMPNPSDTIKQDNAAIVNKSIKGVYARGVRGKRNATERDSAIFQKLYEWAHTKNTFDSKAKAWDSWAFAVRVYDYCERKAGIAASDYALIENPGGETAYKLTADKARRLSAEIGGMTLKLDGMEKMAGRGFADFFMHVVRNGLQDGLMKMIDAHPQGRIKCNMVAALWQCEGVASQESMAGKIAEINKRIVVLGRLGVQSPCRHTPTALENTYLTMTGKKKVDKLAYAMYPREDYNGAFYNAGISSVLDQLMRRGYSLIICEAGNDFEMVDRWFNHGLAKGDADPPPLLAKMKYDAFVWGGHGTPMAMDLSNSPNDRDRFNVKDTAWMGKYDFRSMLNAKANGALISCSTGKQTGKVDREYFVMFTALGLPIIGRIEIPVPNLMQAARDLTGATVFAPTDATYSEKLVFDREGYVSGMEFEKSGGEWFKAGEAAPAGPGKTSREKPADKSKKR